MFKRKIRDVVPKVYMSKEEYGFIVANYGELDCKNKAIGKNLNYYDLYKLKENPNNFIFVIQDSKEKNIYNMDPFKEAFVIFRDFSNKCRIYKFIPTAFSCVILLKNIEEIKENFELYNVFFPDGKKVNLYEELEYRKEFFAISKKTFSRNRKSATQSIHMILRYCPFYIDFSTWG